jgi:hypothetical protein
MSADSRSFRPRVFSTPRRFSPPRFLQVCCALLPIVGFAAFLACCDAVMVCSRKPALSSRSIAGHLAAASSQRLIPRERLSSSLGSSPSRLSLVVLTLRRVGSTSLRSSSRVVPCGSTVTSRARRRVPGGCQDATGWRIGRDPSASFRFVVADGRFAESVQSGSLKRSPFVATSSRLVGRRGSRCRELRGEKALPPWGF